MKVPCQIEDLDGNACTATVESHDDPDRFGYPVGACDKCGAVTCDGHAEPVAWSAGPLSRRMLSARLCVGCRYSERLDDTLSDLTRLREYLGGSMSVSETAKYGHMVEANLDALVAELVALRAEIPKALASKGEARQDVALAG